MLIPIDWEKVKKEIYLYACRPLAVLTSVSVPFTFQTLK